jgi:hypothetical protein
MQSLRKSTWTVRALIASYTETLHLKICQRSHKINWMEKAGAPTCPSIILYS